MASMTQRWVARLLGNLAASRAGKQDLAAALASCGRQCLPASMLKRAQGAVRGARSRKEALAALARVWPHLEVKGERVAVVYPRCYCPIMRGYDGPPLPSFCKCSRGWIAALFEEAFGADVTVKAEQTILAGGDSCRFRVVFGK